MLKRIKETLTCSDSSGGTRLKLKSHHLLHSDKSTYTYFYKGKVKSLLYSPSIPLLGGAVLLLVLGMSVGCVGSNKAAYAETVTEEQCNSETKLALSLNGVTGDSVSLSKNVDDDIASGNISKVSQDFNVVACMVRNYKLYVQAESSLLKNTNVPDALYGVGENVAESAFSENTWGYSVAPKGSSSTTYNTVPELAETIPEAYTGNTSTSNTGQDFTITFAAKFGNNKPAGHYTSNVLLSMVAEPKTAVTYSLSYNGNGNTGGSAPETQTETIKADSKTFTVARNTGNLTKTGYAFAGWAETTNASTAQYQPGNQIELTIAAPTKTLYAVWDSIAPVNTWSELKYMQQMTSAACNTASGEKTLIDSRDRTTYTVKKLSDGKCWMTKNLDLNLQASKKLTPADSDVKSDWDPEQTTITEGDLSTDTWPTSQVNIIRSYDSGNTTYGNYYSWVAAKAGSTDTTPDTSICPKGWRLPTGGSNGEFKALNDIYPKGTSSSNPGWNNTNRGTWFGGGSGTSGGAFFPAGGGVSGGSLKSVGGDGYYWSSTASSVSAAYNLDFYYSSVSSFDSSYARYNGRSVRCVAR